MISRLLSAAAVLALVGGPVMAQEASSVPPNLVLNTMFTVFAAILVMWMAAGFTMLETGFVRATSVAMQCAKNIGLFAVASTCFYFLGYSLMFPEGSWIVPGIFGTSGLVSLATGETAADGKLATGANVFYQMMFCAATASIVSGALAERLRLVPFLVFTAVLTAVIYPIQASWVWGGGFLSSMFGFYDLAGGTVVHVVGGAAALAGVYVVGSREGRFRDGMAMPMPGSNLPLATLGAIILWMGWFGFTAGSHISFATEADAASVSRILVNTNLAAAGGVLAAMVASYMKFRQIDLTFLINGALAGLVAITAGPLFPAPYLAFLIGAVGGIIVVLSVPLLDRLKIDDVVGAIPVHLFCGVWGTIAVLLSNPDATWFGQLASIGIILGFVLIASLIVWTVLSKVMSLRVSEDSERNGIDLNELGQEGYPEFAAN
ncbi:MAG: ammonium transporter [Pseudomonadota bacterium]